MPETQTTSDEGERKLYESAWENLYLELERRGLNRTSCNAVVALAEERHDLFSALSECSLARQVPPPARVPSQSPVRAPRRTLGLRHGPPQG